MFSGAGVNCILNDSAFLCLRKPSIPAAVIMNGSWDMMASVKTNFRCQPDWIRDTWIPGKALFGCVCEGVSRREGHWNQRTE